MRLINQKREKVDVPFYSEPGGCGCSRRRDESRIIRDSVNVGNYVSSNNEFPGGYGATGYEDGDEYGFSKGGKRSESEYAESRGVFRGAGHRKFRNGEVAKGNFRKRIFDRHSQSGRLTGMKRRGGGRANWGSPDDYISLATKEAVSMCGNYLDSDDESECEYFGDEKEDTPEDELYATMTLKEHEEVLEQKKKSFKALKT